MHEYMKYIIVKNGIGRETAVLFHHTIEHCTFARGLFSLDSIISAGFCWIKDNGNVTVFGKSDSLKKEVRKDKDPQIIKETIRPHEDFDDCDRDCINIFNKKIEEDE